MAKCDLKSLECWLISLFGFLAVILHQGDSLFRLILRIDAKGSANANELPLTDPH